MKKDLEIIETQIDNGDIIAKRIRNRLFQVRKRHNLTIQKLLTSDFFANSESTSEFFSLTIEGFTKRINAAYDLRSLYVHTGTEFGPWLTIGMRDNYEINLGQPVIKDKTLKKLIQDCPTLFGLERIMRYCLLRFIHLHGCKIDDSLEGDGLIK